MMGRYQISYSNKQAGYNESPEIHPVWRGIGFALIILIPALSYVAGLLIIAANKLHNYVAIPADLIAPFGDPYLYLKIILTVAISFVIYTIFMLITFVAHRMFGPERYGPTDAPPIQRKVHRRWK
jgi:hypothetical protein